MGSLEQRTASRGNSQVGSGKAPSKDGVTYVRSCVDRRRSPWKGTTKEAQTPPQFQRFLQLNREVITNGKMMEDSRRKEAPPPHLLNTRAAQEEILEKGPGQRETRRGQTQRRMSARMDP